MVILYEMPALFPYGTPYASRVLNFSRLLTHMGHKVIVFCDYISDLSLVQSDGIAYYEGVEIHFTSTKRNLFSKATVAFRTPLRLKSYLKNNHVDALIADSGAERFLRILKISKKYKIPIFLETCEKYHPSNWMFGQLAPRYWRFEYCWRFKYDKVNAVIAISRFLESHFKEKGKKAIRIPTILDVEKIPFNKESKKRSLSFVFSGALGHGKDSLVEFMTALNHVKSRLSRKIELNIYGPSKEAVREQLEKNATVMQELGDMVHYHGRIPQNEIPLRLLENDFGIILRPQRESSNAGFPTKLAEYMAAGLPVLANDTGDISLYLNITNGILLENKSIENVENAILAIDSMSNEELSDMRKSARYTAEKNFDYRNYMDLLDEFLKTNVRL